tara:strand:+ start:2336 stop:3223 length:888 start_codon:yes stop_codon:yes gene_type:complete
MLKRIFLLVLCCLCLPAGVDASETSTFSFQPKRVVTKAYGIWGPPALNLLLPGFDQFYEGQTGAGLTYFGLAALGMNIYRSYGSGKIETEKNPKENARDSLGYAALGGSLYQNTSFMSAYHSFATSVQTRPDDFSFIQKQDSPADLALAPFDFRFLRRSSTYIPLGIIAGFLALSYRGIRGEDSIMTARSLLSFEERFASVLGLSFGAAVGEEALFRGWLLPAFRYSLGSKRFANVAQSIIFGLAHYGPENPAPVVQTLLGYYWGSLTERAGYSMREAVFQHYWWDAMIFATAGF